MYQMVSTATLALIEGVINQALALDEVTLSKLARLEGKHLSFGLKQPNVAIGVQLLNDGVRLSSIPENEPDFPKTDLSIPDLSIKGTTSDFIRLALADDINGALFGSDIEINGDEQLAQKIMTIALELNIDWEYVLAKVTGDVIAHQIGQSIRASGKWLQKTHQSMTQNLEEYIHHELRTLPHASEIDYYCELVTHLRLQTDRLNARISNLEQQSANQKSNAFDQDSNQQGVVSDQP
ncbi:ubiquinone biosynthesis accessory factor UbiJ [Litoribacillus peritrichatus]|uniref:Ubiquinone biosynthesis accessory factor UbiJ n=1 Tax=Litoribacillus peritrichatus TaxID=718191 RepID=A0ABP7MVJ6_9GAMM